MCVCTSKSGSVDCVMPGTVHVTSRRQAFQTSVIHTDFGAYSVTFLSSRFTFSKNNWHKLILKLFHISIFFFTFYLFTFTEGKKGRKRGRETSIGFSLAHSLLGTWPATQACALTEN